jgi:hypothetical protein
VDTPIVLSYKLYEHSKKWKPTFLSLVSSLALRAALVPLLALILIARAADREGTLIAGNKDITSG